jgi:hypothetical protein
METVLLKSVMSLIAGGAALSVVLHPGLARDTNWLPNAAFVVLFVSLGIYLFN